MNICRPHSSKRSIHSSERSLNLAAALRISLTFGRHNLLRPPQYAVLFWTPRKRRADLSSSADRVFADVQKDARSQSDYFSGLIVNYSRVFSILSLLCLVSAGGVFLYLNRSVISRLQKLSENMRRSAAGTATPILISGNDEISDMARAADFFATSLVQREQGLRESVAELRALGEVT